MFRMNTDINILDKILANKKGGDCLQMGMKKLWR